MELEPVAFDEPVVQALIAEVQAEYVIRYGSPDETPLSASMFAPGSGAFFVGLLDERPVAMGGWRFRPDVPVLGGSLSAEVKRMYVTASARGRGFARAVLRRLEESAREAGADRLILETGLMQPEALALYESAGYVPIESFGFYRDSDLNRCLAKPLR